MTESDAKQNLFFGHTAKKKSSAPPVTTRIIPLPKLLPASSSGGSDDDDCVDTLVLIHSRPKATPVPERIKSTPQHTPKQHRRRLLLLFLPLLHKLPRAANSRQRNIKTLRISNPTPKLEPGSSNASAASPVCESCVEYVWPEQEPNR